jgi:hypothetical protein
LTCKEGKVNPLEQILDNISSMGPNSRCAMYEFATVADGQSAAHMVVDAVPSLAPLARSGRASIGTIRLADCTLLIVGGLLSAADMETAHRTIIRAGGKLRAAATP